MRITVSDTDLYYPKWNDNGKQPAEERIFVEYKMPSLKEKNRLRPAPPMQYEYDTAGNFVKTTMEMKLDKTEVVRTMTVRIGNLEYEKSDGAVKKIINAETLFSAPSIFSDLADELFDFYQEKLSAKEASEKNSKLPSGFFGLEGTRQKSGRKEKSLSLQPGQKITTARMFLSGLQILPRILHRISGDIRKYTTYQKRCKHRPYLAVG